MNREEAIDRLALAMADYRDRLPRDPSARPAFVKALARRYNISIQIIRKAVEMMREVEDGHVTD
jgi:hypothetical protein